ncbi:hypothetical protein CJJ23_01640 [Mycoplasmopsis agassizii]|uniref:S1 motif domain-containing protein n=2 Tax=Mycoplasmopsis agassizii TaxID=33922 RepID=A0A269TJB2_9BACT|nr:hypothetical protein CJJ23_01640 [Mycoplasmopsis agassizii]
MILLFYNQKYKSAIFLYNNQVMKVDQILKVKIYKINGKGVHIKYVGHWRGIIQENTKGQKLREDVKDFLLIGEFIEVQITKVDDDQQYFEASFNNLRPNLDTSPSHYQLKQTVGGFRNLKKHLDKEIKEWKKSN